MLDSFFESVFDTGLAELSAPIGLSRNLQPFRFQLVEAAYPLSVPMTPGNQPCIGETSLSTTESDHVLPLEIPPYWRPFFDQSRQKLLDLLEGDPDKLAFTGVNMGSPQEVMEWFRGAFVHCFVGFEEAQVDPVQRGELIAALYEIGVIIINALGNWLVNRPGVSLAQSLCLRSLTKAMEIIFQDTEKVYYERGTGNNRNVEWIRNQFPEVECKSIGHLLYFSLTDVLYDFLRPELQNDEDTIMFIRILSTFLVRELKDMGENASINDLFPLFAQMEKWMWKYFSGTGVYVDSAEYEFDTLRKLEKETTPDVFNKFRELHWFFEVIHFNFNNPQTDGFEASPELVCKRKEIYLSILMKYFQQPFCNEISRLLFSDNPWSAKVSNGIDLRKRLPVSLQGYTQGYFTDIPSLLPEKKIGFSTDVRAASHEDNEMYRRDITGFVDRLAEGGVLDHDAGRESYIRDDRSDILLEILTEKNCSSPSGNEYRGYAFVEKGASPRTRAQAIWIERAQKNGTFRSLETIGQCIDVEKYDIIPLKEYANRFFIRYESRIRRIFKTVFYEKYGNWDRVKQQFVNEKVKKTIEDWIQFIETHMPDLLEMDEIFSIIGSEVRMSAFECATSVPETKSIQVKVPPIYKVDEISPSRTSLSLVMRP